MDQDILCSYIILIKRLLYTYSYVDFAIVKYLTFMNIYIAGIFIFFFYPKNNKNGNRNKIKYTKCSFVVTSPSKSVLNIFDQNKGRP